ncbi:MAG: RnfABCDGE type electron transport complex subunit B [Desulfuromonas sp.]|nr:RnfABCDGE type electron transport complex subunit B [Desulfuromonas sp.]
MLSAVLGLGQIGLVAAIALGWASKKFAVDIDARELDINEVLPGVNCGACGYPGCSGYAAAIVEGKAAITLCPPGGGDVVEHIAEIMGLDANVGEPLLAVVLCQGDNRKTTKKYRYLGLHDCNAASKIAGGPKDCPAGCLGLGSCVASCPFEAIEMTADGLAIINRELCTGCGHCIDICPRQVIRMTPARETVHVLCNSHDKGGVVRKYCETGCIGCNICKKTVPEAYKIDKFLARVDYDHAEHAALAIEKCPPQCIRDFKTAYPESSHFRPEQKQPSATLCAGKDLHG